MNDLEELGDSLRRWRKLRGLTAQIVAERADITRGTLRSIETGAGTVQLRNVLALIKVLGLTRTILDAAEPLNSELGRINADLLLPERVSRRRRAIEH